MSRACSLTRLAFFLTIVAILSPSNLYSGQAQAEDAGTTGVLIEHQTFDGITPFSTTYRAAHDDCTIAWIAYNNEPGVVKYTQNCTASLVEQLPLLKSICSAFLSQDRNAEVFHTLFWGRLASDSRAASREMSFRLAAAAFLSQEWDKRSGRPKSNDINRFARDLANQAMIYPELQELFANFHLSVTLSHVEKVLVLKAGQLPFYSELERLGARAADRLPFDCMAWFAVASDITE